MSQLYRDGCHFDQLHASHRESEATTFWLATARRTGGSVLARAGIPVTDLDSVPAMLDEARRKTAIAGIAVDIEASTTYAADTQINHVTTHHQFPDEPAKIAGQLDLRMCYPQELDALLASNGLRIEQKLADYADTPFGPVATKQLILCTTA